MKHLLFIVFILVNGVVVFSQRPGGGNLMQNMQGGFGRSGGGGGFGRFGSSGSSSSGPFKDSLLHRTGMEDSATIAFRYLDTARYYSWIPVLMIFTAGGTFHGHMLFWVIQEVHPVHYYSAPICRQDGIMACMHTMPISRKLKT